MTSRNRSCVVVGLGNIGSPLAGLVARLPEIGRMVLVDFDDVEERNLVSQSVLQSDVGRPKAQVVARRIRGTRSDIDIEVHACRLEDVPLGRLRADVVLGCLDSRAARMALNERAVALGVPLIDAGVSAGGLLVRVTVCDASGPCAECSWSPADYDHVESIYACDGSAIEVAATAAPAYLGAAAAAFQAALCSEILTGSRNGLARETILDLANGRLFVSSLRPRTGCRLAPHESWPIAALPRSPHQIELQELFDLVARGSHGEERSIEVSRSPFAMTLRCIGCGATRRRIALARSLTAQDGGCRTCGGRETAAGFDRTERLGETSVHREELRVSLAAMGLRRGDVVTVRCGNALHRAELTVTPGPSPALGATA